ncbi:TetR/AcrR family transcriptional regulator [Chitinophaga rhizosphaerae]|uniref:TetR/AcrR family transcriptional regulator n=1 Tax=Chitinophaga rhizosphaerae TaxID=1864947 RepID=UPI000F811AFF|nr:TetR/AcrR family transcriptional regulator [Chitinophaga rhizosphaerae]
MQTTNTTEQQIIEAARKIFMHRGLTGARMQDIADEAGINKAMLHYYYRSKDKLFDIVLTEAVDQMLSRLNAVFSGDLGLEDKIRSAVDNYISGISENPYLPLFVLNEINQNPGRIATRFLSAPNFPNILGFAQQLMAGMEKGTLRRVDPVQLMISIISMCIFPFVARPLLQAVFTVDDPGFLKFMEDRKAFVTEFVLSALRP